VSTKTTGGGRRGQQRQPDALAQARLGFLLKHAHLSFAAVSTAALAPYGIDGRERAVLAVMAGPGLLSQQEVAGRLGVDRTTMVALIDELERKNLVERRPHPDDRRKNIVELTAAGRKTLAGATRALAGAERRFLEPLGEVNARRFTEALRTLFSAEAADR
jgi:DNA-binding MarR family transcriptional regulator